MTGTWSGAARWVFLAASIIAVVAVVSSSLNADHYHFYSAQDRRTFSPDLWAVVAALFLSASEGLVLWLILNFRNGTVSWRRFLFGLALFVPWLVMVVQPIGPHVAGFLIINALYVALIVVFLISCLMVSVAGEIRLRLRAASD